MQITLTFDDGNVLSLNHDSLELRNQDNGIALVAKVNTFDIPLLNFTGLHLAKIVPPDSSAPE